ncbi:MAG: hypothetical protein KAW92_01555 [Candidatus Cloacimonetes bacterium]|nr:hypothetical protein [Candidatus Cloacimonadota bacterium]
MIIIKDGVKYKLWEPRHEVSDFEPMIMFHVRDIFGNGCVYFPKQKLNTLANIHSISDGFVVDFKRRKWYIVELKLLCDDAIKRISGQIVDYKNAIRNQKTRRRIYKAIKSIKDADFLDDLINDEEPDIVVIINSLDGELGKQFKEKVQGTDSRVKIVEFRTFAREGVNPIQVHIHLFEPMYQIKIEHLQKLTTLSIEETKKVSVGDNIRLGVEDSKIVPIGAKGKQIMMVLTKMNEGKNYKTAVSEIAKELNISYQSVSDKCGRQLTGSSKDFIVMVEDGTIIDYLYKKGVIKKTN